MNRKKDLVKISEAYQERILNELGGFTPGDGRSTTPTPNNPTTIVTSTTGTSIDQEEQDSEHTAEETRMVKSELFKLHKAVKSLYKLIGDQDQVEPWVFSKITVAANYLEGVLHYLDYKKFRDEGEFCDTDEHKANLLLKVREMLHGESKEIMESVLREVIFNLEAITPVQPSKK